VITEGSAPTPTPSGVVGRLIDHNQLLCPDARLTIAQGLYLPRTGFFAGLAANLLVSVILAFRIETLPFLVWLLLALVLAGAHVHVWRRGRTSLALGDLPALEAPVRLLLCSAAALGYGCFISLVSGDSVAAAVAASSSLALVAAVCLQQLPAPRFAAAMILLAVGPSFPAALLAGEPALLLLLPLCSILLWCLVRTADQMRVLRMRATQAESDLEYRLLHDPLTGLLNRSGLARAAASRIAARQPFALFCLDLDGFRAVNDGFGHLIGDELLTALAERLRRTSGLGDSLARTGGDEFVILCDAAGALSAAAEAERIAAEIGEAGLVVGSEAACVGVRIGVALFPDHGGDLGSLLGEAEAALYEAKSANGPRCVIARSSREEVPAMIAQIRPAAQDRILARDAA
jgi:diguanylate cyclase (GGDEF)-like protein